MGHVKNHVYSLGRWIKKTREKNQKKHALNELKAFKMGMIHNEAKNFM